MNRHSDVIIVGTGAAGLFHALSLPTDQQILLISKDTVEHSDSFLAQGGICVMTSPEDYDSYYEDTMKAGHYVNRPESVDIMIRSSREIIGNLIHYGVEFEHDAEGSLLFTREGGHSKPRILFHEDITGHEITSKLLARAMERDNITILEHTSMIDILEADNICYGIIVTESDGTLATYTANYTVLACGGLGGLYHHSTNFRHLTGDALGIALDHGIELENVDYIQIHPTTLYSEKPGRRFLISESVRGEGAHLLNANKERFVDELLPRDVVTKAIRKQMELDGTPYVWLSMDGIERDEIINHFPNIYQRCLEEGYDVTKECIPVVPAQHYFMGGIWVNEESRTSMKHLYAIGETSCNGVHGANRLASNSLLESMVFAKRAAHEIATTHEMLANTPRVNYDKYSDLEQWSSRHQEAIKQEIERMKKIHEQ